MSWGEPVRIVYVSEQVIKGKKVFMIFKSDGRIILMDVNRPDVNCPVFEEYYRVPK